MSESFEWGSRRGGGLRHAVSVPAHIIGKNGIPIKAEIRNISSTGMFLGYDLVVPLGGPETAEDRHQYQRNIRAGW